MGDTAKRMAAVACNAVNEAKQAEEKAKRREAQAERQLKDLETLLSKSMEQMNSLKSESNKQMKALQAELEVWKHQQPAAPTLNPRPYLCSVAERAMRNVPSDHTHQCAVMRNAVVVAVDEVTNIGLWKKYLTNRQEIAEKLRTRESCPWSREVLPRVQDLIRAFPHIRLLQTKCSCSMGLRQRLQPVLRAKDLTTASVDALCMDKGFIFRQIHVRRSSTVDRGLIVL